MTKQEPFLARWARRKAAPGRRVTGTVARGTGARPTVPFDASTGVEPGGHDFTGGVPKVPPLESLHVDSDFSPFMARGVPRAIRNAALRRLWRLDPSLGETDGLVEYAEDFSDAAKATALVRTAFRVGHGMQPTPVQATAIAEQEAATDAAKSLSEEGRPAGAKDLSDAS